jgi:hypothetical protein
VGHLKPRKTGLRRLAASFGAALAALVVAAPASAARCDVAWREVGSDTFTMPGGLTRSQGVTTDGHSWIFSWQGGLERTDGSYRTLALGTWPPEIAVAPQVGPAGTNHLGGNHIGDVDYYNGRVYAPVEDGGQSAGPVNINDPEYQHPYIALYDARTLAYSGKSYALDKRIHEAGVPWVAVNAPRREVYTAEWDMPHDRINVFDTQLRFRRFLPLVYPRSLGPGFHLSRIQGAKVHRGLMYVTRDDADKTVFSIDLHSGRVSKLFSLKPGVPSELEGLSVWPTADGALLHVIIILDNKLQAPGDATRIRVAFKHYARERPAGCPRQ